MSPKRDFADEARLNESRLEALLKLGQMVNAPLQKISDFVLEQAVTLTQSQIGYLAFMNDEQSVLTMHSWSKSAMKECAIADKPLVYPLESTGLWGEAARQRKPIITNDYAAPNPLKKGMPEGHVPLLRHMNVPIFDEGRVVVVAGVGNKTDEYDESDVRQLSLLMQGMWTLIQRQRIEKELRKYRLHLEQLVVDQTEELQQSHDELKAIYDGMPDGLLVADFQTMQFVRANSSICRMIGYSENELLQMSVPDIHPKEVLPLVMKRFQLLADGHPKESENTPILRKDGSVFYVDLRGNLLNYAGRHCVIGFFRDVTERRKADEALRNEKLVLKHLLQSSDHERQLISYDIHDGLAQYLAGAIFQLQAASHFQSTDPEQADIAFKTGLSLLQKGHFEARRLISGVRPPILDESGITAAIAHLVHDQSFEHGPKIEFRSKVTFGRLSSILENAIYRIIQEGVSNACKHSKSNRVRISMLQKEDRLLIEIRDWGVGFATDHLEAERFGLEGIRQRARLLGGQATVESKLKKGTRIRVDLPLIYKE